jgi:phospholipase C
MGWRRWREQAGILPTLKRGIGTCDRYFSEVAGPSTPNHLMLICADAPIITTPTTTIATARRSIRPAVPSHALENKNLTWGNYGGYAFHYIADLAEHRGNHTRDLIRA